MNFSVGHLVVEEFKPTLVYSCFSSLRFAGIYLHTSLLSLNTALGTGKVWTLMTGPLQYFDSFFSSSVVHLPNLAKH